MIGSSRVETLVLNTPLDLDRAMASTTQPRTVVIAAHLLAPQPPQQHWHSLRLPSDNWSPLHRVLRRVGCLEVCVQGKSSAVPRRVYEHELVALLQSIPKAHRRLRKIVLKNLDVQRVPELEDEEAVEGTTNSTQNLSNELLQLRGLQELHIQSCRLDEPTTLVDLIATLTHLKSHLRQVTLEWLDPIQLPSTHHLLVQTLTALVQPKSSALTSLAVSEYPHSMAFWRGIATSKTLTHLSLSLDYPHTESSNDSIHTNVFKEAERQLFWDLLQQNTSIEQLELQVGGFTTTTTSPLDPLMALLKTNTTWKSLLVHLNGPKDDASQVHHTTTAFTLRPPLPNATTTNNNTPFYYYLNPTQVAQDVSDILEQDNYTLRQVHVLCFNLYGFKVRIPHTQLDFYCKLNRQGRHKLLLLEDNDDSDSDSDCEEEVVTSSRRSTDSIVSYFKKTTSAGGPNNSSSRASHAVTSGAHAKMDRPTTTTTNSDDHNQVWVDTALAANTYDVPAVYYWLQSNPNLFSKFLSSNENDNDNKPARNKNGMTKVSSKPASPMTAICVH